VCGAVFRGFDLGATRRRQLSEADEQGFGLERMVRRQLSEADEQGFGPGRMVRRQLSEADEQGFGPERMVRRQLGGADEQGFGPERMVRGQLAEQVERTSVPTTSDVTRWWSGRSGSRPIEDAKRSNGQVSRRGFGPNGERDCRSVELRRGFRPRSMLSERVDRHEGADLGPGLSGCAAGQQRRGNELRFGTGWKQATGGSRD